MGLDGAPQAAGSAAVLGSRNARRQVRAALEHAREAGAYSVGFSLGRGSLTGFTIYLEGNCTGGGARRTPQGTAAVSAVPPQPGKVRPAAGHSQPRASAAASRGQRPSQHVAVNQSVEVHDAQPQDDLQPQARDAPAGRKRGCRAGARRRARRKESAPPAKKEPQRPPLRKPHLVVEHRPDVQPQDSAMPQAGATAQGEKKRKVEHGAAAVQRPNDEAPVETAPRLQGAGHGAPQELASDDQCLCAHLGPMGSSPLCGPPRLHKHPYSHLPRPLSFHARPFFPMSEDAADAYASHGRS